MRGGGADRHLVDSGVSLITVNFKCVCVCASPSSIKGLTITPARHHRLTLGALGAHGCWGSFVVWGFFCDASWVCLFGNRSSVLLEVLLGDAFGALLGDPLDDPLATSRVCFWATSWELLMGCLWVSACGLSGMRVVDLLCPGELFGGAMGVPLGGWGGAFGAALGRYFWGTSWGCFCEAPWEVFLEASWGCSSGRVGVLVGDLLGVRVTEMSASERERDVCLSLREKYVCEREMSVSVCCASVL